MAPQGTLAGRVALITGGNSGSCSPRSGSRSKQVSASSGSATGGPLWCHAIEQSLAQSLLRVERFECEAQRFGFRSASLTIRVDR